MAYCVGATACSNSKFTRMWEDQLVLGLMVIVIFTPNSIMVALAIGHWQLGIGHLGIRTQCNVLLESLPNNSFPMRNCQCPKQPLLN